MLRRQRVAILVVLIVGFWLAMTVLLLRREVLLPRLSGAAFMSKTFSAEPTDAWMGIFLSGQQVGFVNMRTWPDSRDGTQGTHVAVTSRLRLEMLGETNDLNVTATAWYSSQHGLSEFDATLGSGGHDVRVEGKVADGVLVATLKTAGECFPIKLPLKENSLLLSGNGSFSLAVPDLESGQEFLVDTFDPLTMSTGRAKIAYLGREWILVAGKKVNAKVISTSLSDITSKAWIDDNGEVLRAETPVGFVLEKITPEQARKALDTKQDSSSLINLAAIHAGGATPIRGAKTMVIQIADATSAIALPSDETQVANSTGEYTISIPDDSASRNPVLADTSLAADLASDAFVQADHPSIKKLAAEITGDATTQWQKACRINDWVYASIDKKPVMSIPSALDVLETREGDCNEHAVLYTALARAAGIPTRIAIGIVWSEEYKAFYYHAWNEVFVDRWVWTDPTFGQHIADATHIKMLNGGIEKWWQIMPFLGHLQFNVTSVE